VGEAAVEGRGLVVLLLLSFGIGRGD
jgi:hypothetical protein